jgi:hypothetical protein
MQQQLIERLTQHGIPQDKAQVAVDTVVGYLKEHLPGSLGSQLDSAISGEESEGVGPAKAAAKNIGSAFGKK